MRSDNALFAISIRIYKQKHRDHAVARFSSRQVVIAWHILLIYH